MSTKNDKADDRPEFDFTKAKPNKYAKMFTRDVRLIPLDPDLSEYYADAASINNSLRFLVENFSAEFLKQVQSSPARKRRKKSA
jgi:hypothetical protein